MAFALMSGGGGGPTGGGGGPTGGGGGPTGGGGGPTGGGGGPTGGGGGPTGGGGGPTGGGGGPTGGGGGPTGGGGGPTGGGGGPTGGGGGPTGYGAYSYAAPKPITIAGPIVIAQNLINFRIQRQQESEWCWAAVAVSVDRYFDPDSTLKQCNIVNRFPDDIDAGCVDEHKAKYDNCCGGCDDCKCCCYPECCNYPGILEDALQSINKWRNTLGPDPPRPLRFDELQREIDAGRPVCAGISWKSGNSGKKGIGHSVVVRGYRVLSSGVRQVYVADPLNPSALVDFDEFTLAYYGDGQWIETDLVQSDWA